MPEKIQIGIYAFKDEITENVKGKTETKPIDIDYLTKALKKKKFKPQDVLPNLSTEYEIYLFFKRKPSKILWKGFIAKIAQPGEDVLNHTSNQSESYILILRNIKSKKLYAVTGGHGHTSIKDFIETDFGLEILSRIIRAEDKTIRSAKEKSISGGILGTVKFFRNDYNLNENESFGNFYQELQSSLNQQLLIDKFGLSQSEMDSGCLCVAKSSFTLKKSISFSQLLVVITNCASLIQQVVPVVEINGVRKLTTADSILIEELDSYIFKAISDEYSGATPDIDIELCPKDFDGYLNASRYNISGKIEKIEKSFSCDDTPKQITAIINFIRGTSNTLSEDSLARVLSTVRIESVDADGMTQTVDWLKNHYYSEVQHKQKSYLLSENTWFEIKSNFIGKLNDQCKSFISANTFTHSLYNWNHQTEDENAFNKKHIGRPSYLVFDKFTPENIEACDIMHWDTQNVYLIHVKKGFDNSMRDLCHQVYIACRRISEDIKSGSIYLKALYDGVAGTNGTSDYFVAAKGQFASLTKDSFINLFLGRKIVFVLAVLDTAATSRNLTDVDSFDSNIAKFELNELIKSTRAIGATFQVCQIQKYPRESTLGDSSG